MRRAHTVLLAALCACVVAGCGLSRMMREARAKARTAAPTATPTPIPGFARIEGTGIELWLPDTYRGGDPALVWDELQEILADLGHGDAFDEVPALASVVRLLALDTEPNSSGGLTFAAVATEHFRNGWTIDAYTKAVVELWQGNYELVRSKRVKVAGNVAQRMEFTSDYGGAHLVYVVRRGDRAWLIVFTTVQEDYEELLPVWEQSIQTFRITN